MMSMKLSGRMRPMDKKEDGMEGRESRTGRKDSERRTDRRPRLIDGEEDNVL